MFSILGDTYGDMPWSGAPLESWGVPDISRALTTPLPPGSEGFPSQPILVQAHPGDPPSHL